MGVREKVVVWRKVCVWVGVGVVLVSLLFEVFWGRGRCEVWV